MLRWNKALWLVNNSQALATSNQTVLFQWSNLNLFMTSAPGSLVTGKREALEHGFAASQLTKKLGKGFLSKISIWLLEIFSNLSDS